jgi:hypothetical protein
MPPSSSPSGSSGSCLTAHRTSKKRATTGIFRINISQMKVQASTPHRSYNDFPLLPRVGQSRSGSAAAENCVNSRSCLTRATISPPASFSMRSVPNSSTLKDASAVPCAIAWRSTPSE